MTDDSWGVGDKAGAKAFDTARIGDQKVDLIFGEHPHSRRDNNQYARYPDGEIIAFDGHRVLLDVQIKSNNYLKESHYSGNEVRKSVSGSLWADGIQVYEFGSRDVQYALLRAHYLISELSEHPSNWLSETSRKELVGRKIFYREKPAIITRLVESQGAIIIEPDGGKFPRSIYLDDDEEDEYETSVKDDVLTKNVWWFRK